MFQDCFPDPTTLFQLSHRLHGSSRDDVLVTCLMNRICEGLHASSESRGSRGILQTDRYGGPMRCEALYHSGGRQYLLQSSIWLGEMETGLSGTAGLLRARREARQTLIGLTTATGRAKCGDRLRDCWVMWVATFPEMGGRWLKSEPEDAEISLSGGNMMSSEENITSATMSCAGLVVGL